MFDLSTLSISALVALHNNEIPGTRVVKTFKDKATAVTRVQAALDAANLKVVIGTESQLEVIPSDIVAASEVEAGPGLARLRGNEKAGEIRQAALDDFEKARKNVKSSTPRILSERGDMVITVLASENPKRLGAATRFSLYETGMTVDQYVAKSVAAGNSRRLAVADVRWDESKGFIKIGKK